MEIEKGSKMTPSTALFHTMSCHWMIRSNRKWPKPGQLVANMGPEIREALSRLTSDEAREMSVHFLGGLEFEDERLAREKQERAYNDRLFAEDMERRRASMKLKLMFERKLRRPN